MTPHAPTSCSSSAFCTRQGKKERAIPDARRIPAPAIVFLLACLTLAVFSPAAQAATFNVADGDVAGLIAAINTANANCAAATTINLAPGGTYTLTAVAENPPEYNAPAAVGLPVIRVSITINGNGATIRRSTASGTPDFVLLAVSGRTASGPPACYSDPVLTLNQTILTGGSQGGLHMNSGNAVVRDSTVTQNTGGGGISNACGSLTLLNSTVSHNTSDSGYGGGGVFFWGFSCAPDKPSAEISFSTIYENSNPGWGRGNAIGTAFAPPGRVLLKNSILASPSHPSEAVCNSGNNILVSLGHNVLGDNADVFGSRCADALTAPGDRINTNPLLAPLADNGGTTPTHASLVGSPAVDAVPLADCTDVGGAAVATDQRGVARPQGVRCDIGAYETQGDSTPPIVTPTVTGQLGDDGWYVSDVQVSWAVSDAESAVASTSGCGTTNVTADTASVTFTCSATSGGGTAAQSVTVKRDATPPSIAAVSPDGGNFVLHQAVTLGSVTATDGLSGVVSTSPAAGTSLDTSSVGAKSFNVTATDAAGNVANRTVNYTVGFAIAVLFDQGRAVKSGSTIPVKIQLVDANGANVSSPAIVVHSVSVIQISSNASVALNDAGEANPDFDFRFDSALGGNGGYVFNLKTTGYGTGTYLLNYTVGGDPVMHAVQFQVRQ